jgi:hypothetical protein
MLVARMVGVALLATTAPLLAPRPVEACTCSSGPTGAVRWPRDGAVDVAIDSPIVIERYYLDGDLDEITYELRDADGEEVALEEMRRLDPPWEGCGKGEYLFLRPEEPLVAGATYTLNIGEEADPEGQWGATFTVGEQPFEPQAPIDLDLTYLVGLPERPCEGSGCTLGQMRFEIASAPEAPTWIVMKSSASAHGVNQVELWPGTVFPGSSVQLSVVLPEDDRCIDLEVVGVDGRPLHEERRCEPDRCVVLTSIGVSTCGDPPTPGADASMLPSASCGDAPASGAEPGVADGGAGDAGALPERKTIEAERPMKLEEDGCSVRAPGRTGVSSQTLALAVALWLVGRARRRVR